MKMELIDLTPVFQAMIALLSALITYRLVPWLQGKLDEQQRAKVSAAIRVAVFAAEQLYGAGRGEEKLAYVTEYLRGKGSGIDRAEIEATVHKEFNWLKEENEAAS